jgi:hypothetical protein
MHHIKLYTVVFFLLSSFVKKQPIEKFPYEESGLSKRQAAAHLLGRFTYGVTLDEIDRVVAMGLENWFMDQLETTRKDSVLEARLQQYPILKLTNSQLSSLYVEKNRIYRMAQKEGVIDDSVPNDDNRKKYKAILDSYIKNKGLYQESEVVAVYILKISSEKF